MGEAIAYVIIFSLFFFTVAYIIALPYLMFSDDKNNDPEGH